MRTFSGGRNTVPQIFFNSEHLGGNDDIQKVLSFSTSSNPSSSSSSNPSSSSSSNPSSSSSSSLLFSLK